METSEVLNTAANLIESEGWAHGTGWPGAPGFTGAYCLEGAIMAAAGIEWAPAGYPDGLRELWCCCPAYTAVRAYLNDETPFLWQDSLPRDTGAARVVETLRAAAVIAEAREVDDARHARKVEAVRVLHGDARAEALVQS